MKDGSVSSILRFYSYLEKVISQKQEESLRGHNHLRSYLKGHLRPYLKVPWTYIPIYKSSKTNCFMHERWSQGSCVQRRY